MDEIPHAVFPTSFTQFLPDENNEATRVTFDMIDVRIEWSLKGKPDAYKQANLVGFNARFPFSNDYLVCYGSEFDSKVFKTRIGKPDPRLTTLSPDWYRFAEFMLGNTLVYWAIKGVYHPVTLSATG